MTFPIGHTSDRGRYRIDRLLQGEGVQQLFAGTDTHTHAAVLVALDLVPSRIDAEAFRRTIAHEAAGFAFAYLGALDMLPEVDFDDQHSRWALVEHVPAGTWLPGVPRDAVSLGVSAGRLLLESGLVLPFMRPELMWADGDVVTGITTRARAMFARTTIDAFSLPVFDRFFHAPEAHDDPDDRATVFSLAIMIAEWATGRFPFEHTYHNEGPLSGKHLALNLAKPLATLLSRGMRLPRDERPHLAAFLDELTAVR